jgi:hypothetical protein
MSLKYLWSAWNGFWFGTGSPVPVALFRIAMGALVLAFSILFFPEAGTFFGQHAIVQPGTTDRWMHAPEFCLLAFLPADDCWVYGVLILLAVSGTCLMLGIFSRLNAFICFLLILSLHSRNHFVLHTGDKIMCEMLLYLVFSRCGEALSIKRLARIWRVKDAEFGPASDGSLFGQRLVQVQLAIVYWGAFTSKLHGKTWMDGTAVYFAAHLEQFQRFPVSFLLDQLWASRLFTWGTLLLEFALCFLVWVKELRYPLLFAGVVFHAGLDWVMVIPLFQPIMLSCYLCFVDADDLGRFMDLIRRLASRTFGKPLPAFYDGQVGLSVRLAETVRRLDIFRLVCLEDIRSSVDASRAAFRGKPGIFVATGKDECWLSSTHAARKLAFRLPLIVPFSGLFWLPGCSAVLTKAASILERLYATANVSAG